MKDNMKKVIDKPGKPGSGKRRFSFSAFLNEEGRKIFGPEIFPYGIVPTTNMNGYLAGGTMKEDYYLVYHEEMTVEQADRLLEVLADRFKAPKAEVEEQMMEMRIPLRVSLTTGSGTDTLAWFL
jgi:hypothetical protein